jgi:hypothetical protein
MKGFPPPMNFIMEGEGILTGIPPSDITRDGTVADTLIPFREFIQSRRGF